MAETADAALVLEPSKCPGHGTFGCSYAIDFQNWQVGDLILMSRCRPSVRTLATRTIQGAASRLHKVIDDPTEVAAHCRWDHAAVYTGKGMLVEAIPGKHVRPTPVAAKFPKCRLRVRRIIERDLSDKEKLSVLQEAIDWTVRAEYGSVVPIVADAACALFGLDRIVFMDRTRRVEYKIMCSELWATIIMNSIVPENVEGVMATGLTSLGIWKLISRGLESRGVLPPELSADRGLRDIPLSWKRAK